MKTTKKDLRIKHTCEAELVDGEYMCELCRRKGSTKMIVKKMCLGWKMLEIITENYFVSYVENDGALAVKYEATKGDPDRIVLIPSSHFFFIEFKRKGEQPEPLQKHKHKELRGLGYAVYCTSSLKEAKEIYHKEKNKAAQLSKESG